MTAPLAEVAPAKVNLALHVTGRRPDGLHLLDSLVVFARLGDLVEARSRAGPLARHRRPIRRVTWVPGPTTSSSAPRACSIPAGARLSASPSPSRLPAGSAVDRPTPPQRCASSRGSVGPAAPGAGCRARPRRRPARLPRRPSLPHVRRRRDAGAPRDAPLLDGARQPRGRRPDRGGLRRPRLARRLASLRAAGLLHPAGSLRLARRSAERSRAAGARHRPRRCERARGPRRPAGLPDRADVGVRRHLLRPLRGRGRPPAPPPPPSAAPSPPGGSPPPPSTPIEGASHPADRACRRPLRGRMSPARRRCVPAASAA